MFKNNIKDTISEVFKMHCEYIDIITLQKDDIQTAYNEKTKKVEGCYDKYNIKTVKASLDIKKIKITEKDKVLDNEVDIKIYILCKYEEEIKTENLIKIRDELFSVKSIEITEFTGTKIYILSLIKSLTDII